MQYHVCALIRVVRWPLALGQHPASAPSFYSETRARQHARRVLNRYAREFEPPGRGYFTAN